MAEGTKNRFSVLSDKDTCNETNGQSFEKTMAEAVEEALNSENVERLVHGHNPDFHHGCLGTSLSLCTAVH